MIKKWSRHVSLIVSCFCILLAYQNCSVEDFDSQTGVATSTSGSSPGTGVGTAPPLPTGGGFNLIPPEVTQPANDNVTFNIGQGGGSGTRNVDIEIRATPGANEEFQTMTLRCARTGSDRFRLNCNNRGFDDNGIATIEFRQNNGNTCVAGNAQVTYWVEDADPLNSAVPVLESQRRTINVSLVDNCYAESKTLPTRRHPQDNFGFSVKMTNTFLVASSPGSDSGPGFIPGLSTLLQDTGAITIYRKNGAGVWQDLQTIVAPSVGVPFANTKISSFAIEGNVLAIGVPSSQFVHGAVQIYEFNGNQFVFMDQIQPALFTTSGTEEDIGSPFGFDKFGAAIAISGEYIAVGAPGDSPDNISQRGSVYLYRRSGNTWNFQWKEKGDERLASLGEAVVMNEDHLVVSAPGYAGSTNIPAVEPRLYTFRYKNGRDKLYADVPNYRSSSATRFGVSLSLDGNKLLVGDPRADGRSRDRDAAKITGLAYLYEYDAGGWGYDLTLRASDNRADSEFGKSVSIYGNHIVIGAPTESQDEARKGSAYHYKLVNSNWTQQYKIFARDSAARDYFGNSVSVYGTKVLVGSHLDDGAEDNNVDGLGAFYIYDLR